MHYTIEHNAGQCQIVLSGDLTAATVPDLQAALKQQVDQGARELVFDLENTTMLDSSGIGLLIAVHNSLVRKQGGLRVKNVSAELFKLLQSMRLTNRLNITSSETQHA